MRGVVVHALGCRGDIHNRAAKASHHKIQLNDSVARWRSICVRSAMHFSCFIIRFWCDSGIIPHKQTNIYMSMWNITQRESARYLSNWLRCIAHSVPVFIVYHGVSTSWPRARCSFDIFRLHLFKPRTIFRIWPKMKVQEEWYVDVEHLLAYCRLIWSTKLQWILQ